MGENEGKNKGKRKRNQGEKRKEGIWKTRQRGGWESNLGMWEAKAGSRIPEYGLGGSMALQEKAPAVKQNELSLIPRATQKKGPNFKKLSSDPHSHTCGNSPTHRHRF